MKASRSTAVRGLALSATLLLLGACSVAPQRPPSPSPAPSPPRPIVEPVPAPEPERVEAPLPSSVWQPLRERFAMPGCDYRPSVERWARRYTASPRRFRRSLEEALPFVLRVADAIEKRNLPGELVMLPYVESTYRPVATRGRRPAGIWQLMPQTARSQGLTVRADYDQRLDVDASTEAALGLLERYRKEFGDWRVADLAFNSGEYRVKRALGERDASALSADQLAKLPLSATTRDHLDRLLALACVVAEPERFGVTLPEPAPDDRLAAVPLEAGMDVRLAARLAGVDVDDVKRFNAAYRRHRMAADVPHRLLLPATRADAFRDIAASIPPPLWNDWHEQRAARTSGIGVWAAEVGVPVAVLAAANAVDEGSTVAASTRLLLPGRDEKADDAGRDNGQRQDVYVVKSGDSLWTIARRYGMRAAELKRLNPKAAHGPLHPGDRLQLPTVD